MAVSSKWSGTCKSYNQKSLRPSFGRRSLDSVKALPNIQSILPGIFKTNAHQHQSDKFELLFISKFNAKDAYFYPYSFSQNYASNNNESIKKILQKENSIDKLKILLDKNSENPFNQSIHFALAEVYEHLDETFLAMKHYRIGKALKKYNAKKKEKQKWFQNPLLQNYEVKWHFEATHYNENELFQVSSFRRFIRSMAASVSLITSLGFLNVLADEPKNTFLIENTIPPNSPIIHPTNAVLFSPGDDTVKNASSANKAELNINLTNPNNQGAKGQIEIVGADTTINDPNFEGNAYYLLRNTTGINDEEFKANYTLFPNPVLSNLIIRLPNERQEGNIRVYDLQSRVRAEGKVEEGNIGVNSPVNEMLIVEYESEGKVAREKILTSGKPFTISYEGQSIKKTTGTKGANDNFAVYFTDPTGNLENGVWNKYIEPGQRENITEQLDWTIKDIQVYFNAIGRNVNVDVNGTQKTTDAQGNTNLTLQERMSKDDTKNVNVTYSGTNVQSETFNDTFEVGTNNGFPHAKLIYNFTYESNIPETNFITKDDQGKNITNGEIARLDSIAYESIAKAKGFYPDTITGWAKEGNTTITANMIPIPPKTYNRLVNIIFNSENASKDIEPGTETYLARTGKDTIFANTNVNGEAIFNYITNDSIENAKIGITPKGHEFAEETVIVDEENESYNKNIPAITYIANVPIHVDDADQGNAEGALIEVAGQSTNTDVNGNASFIIPLETNQYNIFTAYPENVKITRGNASHDFAEKNANVILQDGNTPTINEEVTYINEFFTYSNNSSNTPHSNVKAWKDGGILSEGNTDANGNFTGTTYLSTDLEILADSVVVSKPTFFSNNTAEVIMHDGGDEVNNIKLLKPYHLNIDLVNDDGKEELGFKGYVMDVDSADFVGTNGQLQFLSPKDSIDATVGAKDIPYFTGSEKAVRLHGNDNVSITTNAVTYEDASKTIHIYDEDQGNTQGALVEIAGQNKNTDANGNANFVITLPTDNNNKLIDYNPNVNITKGTANHNFAEENFSVNLGEGTNPTTNQEVRYINKFYTKGTTSTAGMNIKIWKDNIVQSETNSNENGAYTTPTIENITLTYTPDSIVFTKPTFTKEIENIELIDGGNILNKNLLKQYIVNIDLVNDDSKTELGFRGYVLNGTDTISVVNFTGTNGQLQFNSTKDSLDVKVGARNIPYFTGNEKTIRLHGNDNVNLTTNAIEYFFNISGNASHLNNNPASGNVETEGLNDNTDVNGDYAINNIQEQRGVNNERVPYASNVIFRGIQDTITTPITIDGNDKIVDFDVPDLTSTHHINGEGQLIGAVINGEPNDAIDYLTQGDIRIKFLKDNAEFDIDIKPDGSFNDSIVGTYNPTDSIIITYVNNPLSTTQTFSVLDKNKPASTGKIRNDGYEEYLDEIWNPPEPYSWNDLEKLADFYVASMQATGYVQHEAKTTLEKITGKEIYFIAMSDSALNNQDAIDMIRNTINSGIKSYDQDTLIFVNYLTNISTGLPISTTEQTEQQEAIDLLEQEMTTRTGIPLTYTKKISLTNPPTNIEKKIIIHKKNDQAYNSQFGDTPTTWNNARASTRPTDGIGLIISELGGGALCIRDLPSSGSNTTGFSSDGEGNFNGLSWIGDVANKTAYIFPETFFRKE